jgi:CRP/FNR family transcriptional regulator, cyclic AMP receptor protein
MQQTAPARTPSGSSREPLSRRIGDAAWQQLIRDAPTFSAQAGDHLGGDQGTVIAVLDGMCRVFLRAPSGRQLTLRYPRSGGLVGLPSVLVDWRGWDAEAVTPVSYAAIPAERIRCLMHDNAQFLFAVAEEISSMAADSIAMLANASAESMSTRVATHLLQLASEPGAGGKPTAHVTHQRLAESTGTAREVVTRVLRRFRTAGAISTGPGTIVILDEEKLLETARADRAAAN